MNSDTISLQYIKLLNNLECDSIGTVFSNLKEFIRTEQLEAYSVQLDNIELSYRYMLQYFERGVEDLKRDEIYNDIVLNIFYLLDTIRRDLFTIDNPGVFYNKIRYYKIKNITLESAIKLRIDIKERISLLEIADNNNEKLDDEYKNLENIENDIFTLIFISRQRDKESLPLIVSILNDHSENDYFKELIISALTISTLEYFDEDKLLILYNNYSNSKVESIQIKSLIGIYLIMQKHCKILQFSNKTKYLINGLNETEFYNDDIKAIILQFVKSIDTERITKEAHDDIIKKLNKISPSVYRKIKEFDFESNEDDENPDWQKILEDTGIDEKIKELSEMQLQGADILMGTFAKLKHFNFFNNIANWFMPFHSKHYLIRQNKEFQRLLFLLNKTSFICDNDRFSFILAVNSAPEVERKLMTSQLESQSIELKELSMSELQTPQKNREKHIILYIQNLYRFYNLFKSHREFDNPFTYFPLINESALFDSRNIGNDILKIVAEFYFKCKQYSNAISLYKKLIDNKVNTFDIYQKIGLCYQHKNDYLEALLLYQKADILNSNNIWTLRHIAYCYKSLNLPEKSLFYYKQAEQIDPDNLKLLIVIGNLYLESGNHNEALKYYYKVYYNNPYSDKVTRLISWCEFLDGNLDRSLDIIKRIKNFGPEDYLNIGHIYLVKGDIKSSIDSYRECLNAYNCNVDKFKKEFSADISILEMNGILKNTISIIYDTVLL